MALLNFTALPQEANTKFELLPKGEYLSIVTESAVKQTKRGDGAYLELIFEVIDGAHKGRKVWERLTVQNASSKALEIGQRRLSNLLHALGRQTVNDSSELHNTPVNLLVDVEPPSGEFAPKNKVIAYNPAGFKSVDNYATIYQATMPSNNSRRESTVAAINEYEQRKSGAISPSWGAR